MYIEKNNVLERIKLKSRNHIVRCTRTYILDNMNCIQTIVRKQDIPELINLVQI